MPQTQASTWRTATAWLAARRGATTALAAWRTVFGPANVIPCDASKPQSIKMFRVSTRVQALVALLDFKAKEACGCLKGCLCVPVAGAEKSTRLRAAPSRAPHRPVPGHHSPHRPCATKPLPAPLHVNPPSALPSPRTTQAA
ncbi:hypothetical protein BDU57DRAFT_519084 [Ampelomyces quisqualis]|uniref:Uncharacterized protein n=1 Tax=Ampelomyces quisqualis TaxID=50730 RepID=A0A6A5QJI3_AMPQU|nr:hypothetical protein BDU57DRAFT_519084 [Ampelomyces quisqualis]